ncbi:kinetochore-associated protein 1 [Octopus sinensis]|uniref:Kinetochore-associated protein 1 n=1 Tax=Octopus sinensis TaxID=2607531 RepID=A0A7E6ESI6_9MOLL|nr:kinetochore-associated protein 1 [Octopus sinensis]
MKMSSWDELHSAFGADETINFGPRYETGTALYQVNTFATLSSGSNEDSESYPHVVSEELGDLFCVAVNNNLFLFVDCQFTTSLKFDVFVDALRYCPDGSFLIVGDKKGIIYIVDTDSSEIIFTFNLLAGKKISGDHAFRKIIVKENTDCQWNLLILLSTGELLIFKDLNKDFFASGEDLASKLYKKLAFRSETSEIHQNGATDVIVANKNIITAGNGTTVLARWIWKDDKLKITDEVENALLNNVGIKSIQTTLNGKYLFVLDKNETLSLWDATSLILLETFSNLAVKGFNILDTSTLSSSSLKNIRLVILKKEKPGETFLEVRQLPDFECIYQLKLGAVVELTQSNPTQENLNIVEGCTDLISPESFESLRFRVITESDAETRFQTLLRKMRFEEAKNFAEQYGLDIQSLHKAHLRHILYMLSPWREDTVDNKKELTNKLWLLLKLVKDDHFVVQHCLSTSLTTFSDTHKLLEYIKLRLTNKAANEKTELDNTLLNKVKQVLFRFYTFCFALGRKYYKAEVWEEFKKADFFHKIINSFRDKLLHVAFTIWRRHHHEIVKLHSIDSLELLLNSVPLHVSITQLQAWLLEDFIPYVIRLMPRSLNVLTSWIILKIKNMEIYEKAEWPSNALCVMETFYKKFTSLLNVSSDQYMSTPSETALKTYTNVRITLTPLINLITVYRQLESLYTKYNFKMTAAGFAQETTESVVFRMLDRLVAIELMDKTLKEVIHPYIKEYQLNEDDIFCKYIRDLLERTHCVNYLGHAHWESKALAVIGYISDVKLKISAVLEVIKWAPIPWSDGIRTLVDNTTKLRQPEVESIKIHAKLVELKLRLARYDLKGIDVPTPNTEEALQFAKYILRRDLPESMDDALHILKPADNCMKRELYVFRLRQYMVKDKLKECFDLLKSLEPELSKSCAQRLLDYCIIDLDEEPIFDEAKTNQSKKLAIATGKCLIECLKLLTTDFLETETLAELKKDFGHLQSLQVEFHLYPSFHKFQKPHFREMILWDYINTTLPEFNMEPEMECRLCRLADILKIPQIDFLSQMIMKAFQGKNNKVFLHLCKKLLECEVCPITAETLYDLCMYLLENLADTESDGEDFEKENVQDEYNLPAMIYRLISLALTYCHPTSLTKFVHLAKTARLAAAAIQQTYMVEDMSLPHALNKDNAATSDYCKWSLIPEFKENCFIMESSALVPLIANSVQLDPLLKKRFIPPTPPASDTESAEAADNYMKEYYSKVLQEYTNTIPPLVDYLKLNRNLELVYQYSMHSFFTIVEYSVCYTADVTLIKQGSHDIKDIMMKYLNQIKGTSQHKELVIHLLQKVFSQRNVDHRYALGLAWSLPKNILSVLKKMRKDFNYRGQMAMAKVGNALAVLHKEHDEIAKCTELETSAYWGYQLGKYKICFKDAFHGPLNEKYKVLQQMVGCSAIDTEVIKKFCKDFEIEETDGLLLSLKYLIKNISASYTQLSTFSASHHHHQLTRVLKIIRSVKSKSRLFKELTQLINLVNTYDYETLSLVLDEAFKIEENSFLDKCKKVLDWLKNYKRAAPISDYELHFCTEGIQENLQYVIECLPSSSATRLAFHSLFGEPWHIISKELDVNNVHEWLLLSHILKLSPDQLHAVALQNTIKVYVSSLGDSKNANTLKEKSRWDPDEINKDMMDTVKNILTKIQDLESTSALATYIMKELPIGAEKVLALKFCVSFTEEWLQAEKDPSNYKKAKTAYLKFKSLYERLANKQVLFLYKLATPELLDLCCEPEKLITELYQHPSILDSTLPEHLRPDINGMAEQIASIHQLTIEDLKVSLVCEWLETNKTEDVDMTMTLGFGNIHLLEHDNKQLDGDNFKRVAYILRSGDIKHNIAFLLGYSGKPKNSVSMSSVCQLKALLCMFDVASIEEITKTTSMTLEEIRRLIQNQLYIVNLEKLNIGMTPKGFEDCNKEKLAKSIWKNQSNGKMAQEAAIIVSSLCFDYKIYSFTMWEAILAKMKNLNMMKELEYILLRIIEIPSLDVLPSLPSAWQTIIVSILNKSSVNTDEERDECLHAFNLIQRCPDVLSLDLDLLAKHFHRLGLPVCAISCLLMSAVLNNKLLQSILSIGAKKLFDSFLLTRTKCIASAISYEVMLLIFQLIMEENLSHIVEKSPYKDAYHEYVQLNQNGLENGISH